MAEDVALEPQVEPTVAPPGAQEPVNWQVTAGEWEKRAKGWQSQFTKLQQEQGNWQQTQAQASQELTQTKAQFEALEAERATLNQQLEERARALAEKDSIAQEATAKLQKYELISSEFPDLVRFSHLLPTTPDEETMRASLTEWRKAMSEQLESNVQQQVKIATAGLTPPASPARGAQQSMGDIQARLNEITGKPEFETEYNTLMGLWLANS